MHHKSADFLRNGVFMRPKINICVLQVSRPFLGFCPDPKHFTVNFKENSLMAEKWGEM